MLFKVDSIIDPLCPTRFILTDGYKLNGQPCCDCTPPGGTGCANCKPCLTPVPVASCCHNSFEATIGPFSVTRTFYPSGFVDKAYIDDEVVITPMALISTTAPLRCTYGYFVTGLGSLFYLVDHPDGNTTAIGLTVTIGDVNPTSNLNFFLRTALNFIDTSTNPNYYKKDNLTCAGGVFRLVDTDGNPTTGNYDVDDGVSIYHYELPETITVTAIPL